MTGTDQQPPTGADGGELSRPFDDLPPRTQHQMLLRLLDDPRAFDAVLQARGQRGVATRQTTFGDPDAVVWDPDHDHDHDRGRHDPR